VPVTGDLPRTAAQAVGVTPLRVEPEAGGWRAARTLFGFSVVQAVGSALAAG